MTSLVAVLLGQAPTGAEAGRLAQRYPVCPYCVSLTASGDTIIGLYTIPQDHRWWLEWAVDHASETLGLECAELFFAQQIRAASPRSRSAVVAEQDRAPCGADCPECPLYQQKCDGCPATRYYTGGGMR
jgi:hypothetical protein